MKTRVEVARETMVKALKEAGFRQGHIANLACLLYNNQRTPSVRENLKKIDGANRMAERILEVMFGELQEPESE